MASEPGLEGWIGIHQVRGEQRQQQKQVSGQRPRGLEVHGVFRDWHRVLSSRATHGEV